MRPNALVFDYNEFAPVPPNEWQGSESRHALALASELSQHLAASGFSLEEPVEDEQAAVIGVRGPSGTTDITITFYPRHSEPDFGWALQFNQRKTLLRGLFTREDDKTIVDPVKEAIADIVASQPARFRNARWMDASAL